MESYSSVLGERGGSRAAFILSVGADDLASIRMVPPALGAVMRRRAVDPAEPDGCDARPFSDTPSAVHDYPGALRAAETSAEVLERLSKAGDASGKDRQFVLALARGLEVLRCFGGSDGYLGNHEIAARTGLPKPTVSRLTYTLTRLGYLSYSTRLAKYKIGPGVLALGYGMLSTMQVRKIARPFMQRLVEISNLSVALATRDRLEMVYLENCRGREAMSIRLEAGSRLPIATTATGRAYLAALPERERGYLMKFLGQRYGNAWPAQKAAIEDAIRQVAARGFCLCAGGWQPGVLAVAVPLPLPDANEILALNCGGPDFLISSERLEAEIGPRLLRTAQDIRMTLEG